MTYEQALGRLRKITKEELAKLEAKKQRIREATTVEDLTRFLAGTIRYDLKFLPSGNGIHALIAEVPGVHDVRVLPVQDEGLQSVEFALEKPGVQVAKVLQWLIASCGVVAACRPLERRCACL